MQDRDSPLGAGDMAVSVMRHTKSGIGPQEDVGVEAQRALTDIAGQFIIFAIQDWGLSETHRVIATQAVLDAAGFNAFEEEVRHVLHEQKTYMPAMQGAGQG